MVIFCKKRMVIPFNYLKQSYPIIKIKDNQKDQIIIIFRDRPIHITVHKTDEGLLRTVFDAEKSVTAGGKARIEIAKN